MEIFSYVDTEHETYGCIDVYKRKYNNSSLFEDPRNSVATEVRVIALVPTTGNGRDYITRYNDDDRTNPVRARKDMFGSVRSLLFT